MLRGFLFPLVCLFSLVELTGPLCAQEQGISEFKKLSAATDWPWWRGPTRNGVAVGAAPTKFSDSEGVLWKTPVPGRGHSSPIVVGQRVFLTTADTAKQIHSVVAFDRADGKQLWQVEVSQGGFPQRNHPKNTEATPTIASDGERLHVTFFHHETVQATALDFKGNQLWQQTVGAFNPKKYEYGYAPSPLLYRGTVIISGEYDGKSFLAALDRTNGKEVWRTPRPSNISFSTPVIAHVGGKERLLLTGNERITSFDPANGKELWSTRGAATATCGTVVWNEDTVFGSGGYPQSETVAIKADGSGKVLWHNNQSLYEPSLIVVDGYVYGFTGRGMLFCWRTSDGREMWKQPLKGPVSASPVLAGGHIYWANERGTLYVFKPNPKQFELVSENQVGSDAFPSPAICGGQVFLRVGHGQGGGRKEMLYCFGSP
jgi:outer membrane protein assembly factor BamB